MKRWNRILAALLAAVLLCGAWTAVAEMELAPGLDPLESNAGIELEIDPESVEGVLSDIAELPEALEIDGLGLDGLETGIAVDENLLAGETEAEGATSAASNSFTDGDYDHDEFDIDKKGILVEYIGDGGDVVIPDGVTSIGKKAFYECYDLTRVTIPNSVTSIGEDAFYLCRNLTSVTIPNGVKSFGNFAFYGCDSLTSVTIPDSVTSIGVSAFGACERLKTINVSGGNHNYVSKDGILYTHDVKTLLQCPGAKASVTIPNSVTSIGDSAFRECYSLTKVTIPSSVASIGDDAFIWCESLTSVTIPSSVTSIGDSAFYSCESLTSITIPSSVTSIEAWAFSDCESLFDVTILARKIDIDNDAFKNSEPTFYIFSGSDAIKWAEDHDYDYEIIENCLSAESLRLKSEQTRTLSVSGYKNSEVTWSSSDKSVATVDNGKVTAKKVGKCVISAKLSSGETLKCKVSVYDPAELNDTTLSLYLDDTYKLKVSGLLNRKVTWSSNNTAVVTVKNGKITAKKVGKCTISAKLSKGKYLAAKTLKCKVTVTDPAALSAEKLTISAVDYAKIKLTGGLKRKVTWSTSDSKVAKITKSDDGSASIKGVKKGTATITAKVEGGKTLKCVVTVVNPLTIQYNGFHDSDEVWVKFTNNSNKKIVYITFNILQYNNRGDKLKSPYDYYYFNYDLNAHSYVSRYYTVNYDTRSIKLKITEVTFEDKTKWKP